MLCTVSLNRGINKYGFACMYNLKSKTKITGTEKTLVVTSREGVWWERGGGTNFL